MATLGRNLETLVLSGFSKVSRSGSIYELQLLAKRFLYSSIIIVVLLTTQVIPAWKYTL